MGMNKREPQNWEALGHRPPAVGAWMTPRNTPLDPHVLPCRIWSFYVKRYNIVQEIRLKNLTPRISFQGHPTLKVIRTDMDRSAIPMTFY